MKRALKWTLYILLGSVALAVIARAVLPMLADRKMARVVKVDVKAVALPTDTAALAQGKYLFDSRGCAECHGAEGKGKLLINDPNGLRVTTPAINPSGAAVAKYSVEDWVRVIRHGVKPDGRPVIIMPSEDYNRLSDPDTGALIAYAKSLQPAGGERADIRMPFIVKALYAVGFVPDAAGSIDHSLPPAAPVPVGVTVEHGKYVSNTCIGCHGPGLSGGKIPGGPPDWPPASNLTPGEGSVITRYDSVEKFRALLRTGKRPDGSAVSTVMPFATLRVLNDTDADALYAYLKTVPPRAAGGR